MQLSEVETDLIGDLAQDDHGLFEVFQFVRGHHATFDDDAVFEAGRQLIRSWLARGWLELAPTPYGVSPFRSLEEISKALDLGEKSVARPEHDAAWLRLAPKAYADVGWIRRAAR